jgi:hypothetical protein
MVKTQTQKLLMTVTVFMKRRLEAAFFFDKAERKPNSKFFGHINLLQPTGSTSVPETSLLPL